MLLQCLSIASALSHATRSGGREVVIDRTAEGLYRNALTYLELWKSRALKAEAGLAAAEQSREHLRVEVQELRQSVSSLLRVGRAQL